MTDFLARITESIQTAGRDNSATPPLDLDAEPLNVQEYVLASLREAERQRDR